MRIYIPSRGRAHVTKTYLNLPPVLQKIALHVVPKDELKAYLAAGFPAISPPPSVDRIAVTRQWIVEHHLKTFGHITDKLVMLDDDLRFYYRTDKLPNGFACATSGAFPDQLPVIAGFRQLSKLLDTHAHGGVVIQLGANRLDKAVDAIYNSRACRVIAYRASVLRQHWPKTKFGAVPVQDDFHATLTLLELGYPNALVTTITNEQTGGSGAAGGASTYRDMAYHAESVHELKRLHPDFVTIVNKGVCATGAWGGQERIDVMVQWKKAIAAGIAAHGLRKLKRSP